MILGVAKKPYGDVVRKHRLGKKMSQGALGQQIGRSKVWVCDLEKGRIGLKADMILPLANALEISPNIFLSIK